MKADKCTPSSASDAVSGMQTRWTLIVSARKATPEATRALNELCAIYWHPIYYYIRRCGFPHTDAEDLVQGFFVRFLSREVFARADRSIGKFRGLLISCLKRFLADERRRAGALKRGGGIEFVPFDLTVVDERYTRDLTRNESPEQCYDRCWALLVLQRAVAKFAERMTAEGKSCLFTALSPFLYGSELNRDTAIRIAAKFFMTEGYVKVTLHRMKEKFSTILRSEVRDIVTVDGEVEEELAALKAALSRETECSTETSGKKLSRAPFS